MTALAAGPRYSIIPAAAVTDPRFQGRDLQILGLIGRHTDRNGWCRLNQRKLALAIDVSRPTVNRSIARLVEWGYLETRTHWRADGGQAASSYRVRMDVDDVLAAPEIDIEDDPDGAEDLAADGEREGAHDGGRTQDVVAPPVHQVNTPLSTLDEHPPVHSGLTPLTTPLSNDQEKAQRQKEPDGPQGAGAQDAGPTATGDAVDDRERDDEGPDDDGSEPGTQAGDEGREEEHAAARSLAARKAADTRAINTLIRDWPQACTESQKRILEAWGALSSAEKHDASERAETYRRRAAEAGRKRPRLAMYLAEKRFVNVVMPAARRSVGPDAKPSARLSDDVVRAFLRHPEARAVLAMAADDDLVAALADEVADWHRQVSPARYRELRGEWLASRASYRRRLETDAGPIGEALRRADPKMRERAAAWQAFAADVLAGGVMAGGGDHARDGPDGRERVSGEAAE